MKRRYWSDEELTWVEERPEYYTDEILALLDEICVPYDGEESEFWCVLPGIGRVHEDGEGGDRGYLLFTVNNDRYVHGLSPSAEESGARDSLWKKYFGFRSGGQSSDPGAALGL